MATKKTVKKEASAYTVGATFFDTFFQKIFKEGDAYPADKVDKTRLEAVKKAGVLIEGD